MGILMITTTRRLIIVVSVGVLAVCLAFAVSFQTPRSVRVSGPSMAETLLGEHGEVACGNCRFLLRFDAEAIAIPARIVCPNCGQIIVPSEKLQFARGDLVRIDEQALATRLPARWDIVAFEVPEEANKLAVKRIIGLPGERISIRRGEVFANDQLLTKAASHPSELWTLVHDGRFAPQSRWIGETEDPSWQYLSTVPHEKSFVGKRNTKEASLAWLTYQHWPLLGVQPPPTNPIPINDFDSYNTAISRSLNDVGDLRLEFDVIATPASVFAVRPKDGWQTWQLTLDSVKQSLVLQRDNEKIHEQPLAADLSSPLRLSVSLRDGELWVSIQEQIVLQHNYLIGNSPRMPTVDALQIGIQQGEVRLTNVKVLRDIYYLHPDGRSPSWKLDKQLGADEYFLLGDNPPVSIDSRHFGPVKRSAIRGIVEKRSP